MHICSSFDVRWSKRNVVDKDKNHMKYTLHIPKVVTGNFNIISPLTIAQVGWLFPNSDKSGDRLYYEATVKSVRVM